MDPSFQTQRRYRIHHTLTEFLINIAATGFDIRWRKVYRFTDDNRYRTKSECRATSRKRFVRPKNPHRHNRGQRFRDHQTDTRQGWLQVPIERA